VRLVATWLSPIADSLRLSAGGACPSAVDSDIPCRPYGPAPRLPPPVATHALRKESRTEPHAPGPIHRSPVRAHDFTAQDAFDWLDPDLFRPGVATSRKVNPGFVAGTPLLHAYSFPPVTVMGRRRMLVSAVPLDPDALRRPYRGPDEDRMPLTRSLQPTCCQRAPLELTCSRARGSHLADLPFGPQPFPNTLVLRSD
jgi:hypothetical protein